MIIYLNPNEKTYDLKPGDCYIIPARVNTYELLDKLASHVCQLMDLDMHFFYSKSRRAKIIKAKRLFVYKARNLGLPFQTIGNYLHVNHATIVHHYYRVLELIEIYPDEWKNLI